MSAQEQLNGLQADIEDAYAAVAEKGGEVPEEGGSSRLAAAVLGIPTGVVSLESIEIVTPPSKTEYYAGDRFDTSGMRVMAHLSNEYTFPLDLSVLTFTPDGTLEVGVDQITVQFQLGSQTVSAAQPIIVQPMPSIYGVMWDGSSATKLHRTDDADLFSDPTPAVGNGTGSSPFDNIYPWSGMTKVIDNSNVLVALPKYWVKVSHFPFRVQITDSPLEGYQVSPSHRDREDGQGERDVVYIGRYECDGSYMSRSGQAPKTGVDLAGFRSGIHALGAEYWQADYALQLTWWFLYIVEFADWDSQEKTGRGNVDSAAKINTGGTDAMTYHTGRAAGTDGQTAIQYRWIENPWGNIREWRDGIVFFNANICTYNNPANFSDTYAGTGSTTWSYKRPTVSTGYIKAFGCDAKDASFIFPSEIGGAVDEFVPDYYYYKSDVRTLSVSGAYNSGSLGGAFFLGSNLQPIYSDVAQGSRLQKLPNAA